MHRSSLTVFGLLGLLAPACAPDSTGGGAVHDVTSADTTTADTSVGDTTGPDTMGVDQSFAAECEVQCRLAAEDWSCAVPTTCASDCTAEASSLETRCGKCVAAQMYFDGAEGEPCVSTPGDVTDEDCTAECVTGTHAPRPDFRAECQVQCSLNARGWGCAAPATCVEDCVATTTGLETQCGKCVASQMYFDGAEGEACTSMPGDVTDEDCREACVPGSHAPRTDFRAECDVQCRLNAHGWGCAVPATCVGDCVAMTGGLETQCGKCVAVQGYFDGAEGEACTSTPGDVTDEDCRAACNP